MSLTNNFIYFIFITQYTEFINGGCVDKPGFEYLIGREKWCKIFTPDQYHDHACDRSTTIMLSTFCHSNSCNDNQCCFTKNSSSTEQENSLSKTAELDAVNSNKIALKVNKFMQETCSCALGLKGSPYSKQFSEETVPYNLNTCLEQVANLTLKSWQISRSSMTRKTKLKHKRNSFGSTTPSSIPRRKSLKRSLI